MARKKKSAATRKQAKKKPAAKRTWQPTKATVKKAKFLGDEPRCGLCGATANLTRTECCGNWICDDEHTYRLFSYARNSCYRNHSRYTLCAFHWNEGHDGHWQDCQECREEIDETEMYVYYGTNEYNFETLKNPPSFEPTKCGKCGAVIQLSEGGYSYSKEGYRCGRCTPMIADP
jgi:hypothetical protein